MDLIAPPEDNNTSTLHVIQQTLRSAFQAIDHQRYKFQDYDDVIFDQKFGKFKTQDF